MKAKFYAFLGAVLMLFSLSVVSFAEESYVTEVETPKYEKLLWATPVGSGWQKPAGIPVSAENRIYIISGDELLDINPQNGETERTCKLSKSQSYGYIAPTYANECLYMNLSGGTVEAVDTKSFETKWIYTDPLGGKGMTSVTYSDGLVFTGFWNAENKDASFVALDSKTGSLKWSITVNGGFYWAGAYCTDNAVIFPTDDGSDKIAHIYSCNKYTGEILSVIDVENKGDVRSSVAFSNESGRIYLTSKGGYIISAQLENDKLTDVQYGEIGAASTSTPVIYNGRIYIGAGNKTISVFDEATLSLIFSIPVKGYPQCTPLISTAYEKSEGYIYLYTTYNASPGGITLIRIRSDALSADDCITQELYDAKGHEQYCISNIISDEHGVLYYKNDSGYLFALEQNNVKIKTRATEDGFLMPQKEVKVSSVLAEKYGYKDNCPDNTVSVLDALVKVHEEMFGEDFSVNTASRFLKSDDNGYITKVFGIDTSYFGFAVNGQAPHEDTPTDSGYIGLTANQSIINENDIVEFFIYRDSWALDSYTYFAIEGERKDYLSLKRNTPLSLNLKGYPFGWYSCSYEEQIANATTDISDVTICLADELTGALTPLDVQYSDDTFILSFEKPGKYIISAKEDTDDEPIIAPWLEVDVTGITAEMSDDIVKIASNTDTDFVVIIGAYKDDILTDVIDYIHIPKGIFEKEIDISAFSDKTVKVFVWDKNLTPIYE